MVSDDIKLRLSFTRLLANSVCSIHITYIYIHTYIHTYIFLYEYIIYIVYIVFTVCKV